MPNDLMLLPSDAPAPLEIYEQPKTHPDNQRLIDERLARFRPLEKRERKQLEKRRKELWRRLNKARYNPLIQRRADLWAAFTAAKGEYQVLHAQLVAGEDRAQGMTRLKALHAVLLKQMDEGRRLNHELAALAPLHQEYVEVSQRLADDDKMLAEEQEERFQQKKFFREARIIEGLLLSTLARTKGCHHIWQDSRGHYRTETPKFQHSVSNADSHSFLIQTSVKQRFGYRDALPYSVDVEALTSKRLAENMSVACGFQVEVRRSPNLTQIFYRINRLDSPDGLPNYFAFHTLLQFYPQRQHDLLPFPLGVFENRRVKWSNLKEDPHILVAGKSKHGKSNYVNGVIATLTQFHSPQEVRFLLCDFKGGVEFAAWKNIPHLLGQVVKHQRDLLPRIREVRRLINQRLDLFEPSGMTDLDSYNQSVDEDRRLPHIVVIIDELQDLLDKGKWTRRVHNLLGVISSLGRAPGVHLILSTQFPNKDVVPMSVKANMSLLVMFLMPAYAAQTLMMDTSASELDPYTIGRALAASGNEQAQMQTAHMSANDKIESARFTIKRYAPSPYYIDPSLPIAPAVETTEEEWETAVGIAQTAPAAASRLIEAAASPARQIAIKPRGFTEEDLISIALDNCDSSLSAEAIFKVAKQRRLATQDRIQAMVREVIERGRTHYQGLDYEVVSAGGRQMKLVPFATIETVEPSNHRVSNHETPDSDSLTVRQFDSLEAETSEDAPERIAI